MELLKIAKKLDRNMNNVNKKYNKEMVLDNLRKAYANKTFLTRI